MYRQGKYILHIHLHAQSEPALGYIIGIYALLVDSDRSNLTIFGRMKSTLHARDLKIKDYWLSISYQSDSVIHGRLTCLSELKVSLAAIAF